MVKVLIVFFFKQKTAYEMRISDWSSDVCSSDLLQEDERLPRGDGLLQRTAVGASHQFHVTRRVSGRLNERAVGPRLLPRKVERRRRYGQGYPALCRLRRLGVLQLQSP